MPASCRYPCRPRQSSAGERLVGAVTFTGPGERSVQLESRFLRSAADEAAREQPEPAGAGGVAAARADHHGADDVEEGDHVESYISASNGEHEYAHHVSCRQIGRAWLRE